MTLSVTWKELTPPEFEYPFGGDPGVRLAWARKLADEWALRLAEDYAAVSVRERNGSVFVGCYAESIPEEGGPPRPVQVFRVIAEPDECGFVEVEIGGR